MKCLDYLHRRTGLSAVSSRMIIHFTKLEKIITSEYTAYLIYERSSFGITRKRPYQFSHGVLLLLQSSTSPPSENQRLIELNNMQIDACGGKIIKVSLSNVDILVRCVPFSKASEQRWLHGENVDRMKSSIIQRHLTK